MGMFDTFYGTVKCPVCKETHNVSEQTKDYECLLHDFTVGYKLNYGEETCVKKFTWRCPKTDLPFEVGIIIEYGIVKKFVTNEEICIAERLSKTGFTLLCNKCKKPLRIDNEKSLAHVVYVHNKDVSDYEKIYTCECGNTMRIE